jgi:nitronate monooxygenase
VAVETALTRLLGIRHPVIQAPMAGGPTTPALVAAVSGAGGLGTVAGAALSPDDLRAAIGEVRALTDAPFAVNLFAPLDAAEPTPEALAAVQAFLAPHRERLGLPPAQPPRRPPWTFADQLDVVLEELPAAFSFTFGAPELSALREAGIATLGTATTVAEARALEQSGVDAVVAQGSEAGGHRGTFLAAFGDSLVGTLALVPQVVDAVSVPVVAAGGIADGRGLAAALVLGAAGAQVGTAFLYAAESGVTPAWREALRERPTTVTDGWSGRFARSARTPFIDELAEAPRLPYPLQGVLMRELWANSPEYGFYLGGQAAALARELPAGELVGQLVSDARRALGKAATGEECPAP